MTGSFRVNTWKCLRCQVALCCFATVFIHYRQFWALTVHVQRRDDARKITGNVSLCRVRCTKKKKKMIIWFMWEPTKSCDTKGKMHADTTSHRHAPHNIAAFIRYDSFSEICLSDGDAKVCACELVHAFDRVKLRRFCDSHFLYIQHAGRWRSCKVIQRDLGHANDGGHSKVKPRASAWPWSLVRYRGRGRRMRWDRETTAPWRSSSGTGARWCIVSTWAGYRTRWTTCPGGWKTEHTHAHQAAPPDMSTD